MNSKTRVEAAADMTAEYISGGTGIIIRPPPLKNSGDCAVRVSSHRILFRTLGGNHSMCELRLGVYSKASDSRDGVRILTAIQDYLNLYRDYPQSDIIQILDISADDISEENNSGEWIYQMNVTVKYFY